MISHFIFSNFKSFKDESVIDFSPANIGEHKDSLILDVKDNQSFLPVTVLYGPNGGGKSTALEAFSTLIDIVMSRIALSQRMDNGVEEKDIAKLFKRTDLKNKYYMFDSKCRNIPCSFDILFRTHINEYRYQINIVGKDIIEENLYTRTLGNENADIVFERKNDECYLGETLGDVMANKINSTMPLLSHIALNYDIDIIKDIISWFKRVDYINYDNSLLSQSLLLPVNKKPKKLFYNMLKDIDINISDVRVEKDNEGNIINIYTKHILENNAVTEIPFEYESSGTRKLFSLLPRLIEGVLKGKVIIADEMDAKLHPKLLRYIIEIFTDPKINKKGAQLIFTSHDMTTMIPEVFRRDEIWFCAINEFNSSHLYSLVSFKKEDGTRTRNDEKYSKRYMEGRYGADPYMRKMLDWWDGES